MVVKTLSLKNEFLES